MFYKKTGKIGVETMKRFVVGPEGISQTCDNCGKDLRLRASYTWLIENKHPANRRFCSIACLLSYEKEIPILKIKEFIEEDR
jgi:hypothetical protein